MRDHPNNYPRTHFDPRDQRRPQRAASGPFGTDPSRKLWPATPMPVNERAYRRVIDPADLFRPRPCPAARAVPGGDDEEPGYVIHLPIRVGNLEAATRLAYTVAGSLAFVRELDPGETTVSTIDDQNNRHRVFCDSLLPDRSRCPQRFEHCGPCGQPDPGSENGAVPRQWDGG